MSPPLQRRVRRLLACMPVLTVVVAGCSHDWDPYDPRPTSGGGGAAASGSSGVAGAGEGGAAANGAGASGGQGAAAGGATTGPGGGSSSAGALYVVGGWDEASSLVADVFTAAIHADGSVGPWETTTPLPAPRFYHAGGSRPGFAYVLGGETDDFTTDALYAQPVDTAALSAWAFTEPFITKRFRHSSVVSVDRVYVIGGVSVTPLADVQRATILADGTLTPWQPTTPLPTTRHRHASSTYNGFVYVLGGSIDTMTAYTNDVVMAPIDGSGALGDWVEQPGFVTTRFGCKSVAANNRVYVVGGLSGSGYPLEDVQYAVMSANGALGDWVETTPFDGGRYAHAIALFNGRIYVVGGVSTTGGGDVPLADVQYATIESNGELGAWQTGPSLPAPRSFHTLEAL
jgi:hypothetical protein